MRITDIKQEIPAVPGSKPIDFTKPLKASGKTFRQGTVVEFIELDDTLAELNEVLQSQPFTINGETHYSDRIFCVVNGKAGWYNLSRFVYFNTARNTVDFDAFIKESDNKVVNAVREATGYEDFYKAVNGRTVTFADEFTFIFTDFNTKVDKEYKLAVYR
jgi:hypothetical protein